MSDSSKQSKRRTRGTPSISATAAGEGVADDAQGRAPNDAAETTDSPAEPESLSIELLAAEVHTSFARNRRWGDVPLELVQEVVSGLDVRHGSDTTLTARLSLHRLRFTGEKTLTARSPELTHEPAVAFASAPTSATSTETGGDDGTPGVEVVVAETVAARASERVAAETRVPPPSDDATPQATPRMTRQAVAYDQRFAPGVNVLLAPNNSVGKSSIFATIKFGLTGDDGGYESDVRGWIGALWLEFALGPAP